MKVAILGAGAMGTGIGQIAAQHGCDVVYFDNYPGAIGRSSASIEKVFGRLVEKSIKMSSSCLMNQSNEYRHLHIEENVLSILTINFCSHFF